MYKFIALLLLTGSLTAVDGRSHDKETAAQIIQDAQLVYFFEQKQNQVKISQEKINQEKKLAAGNIITVGGDPNGCQFNNIQDAIDSAAVSGDSEIHIATNKTYIENLNIDDISVDLIGGYEDCVAAGSPFITPSDDQVVVDGSGQALPVLRITGASLRNTLVFKNMMFKNGVGDAIISGGGIVAINADVRVMLDHVSVNNNTAAIGGGLSILDGNADFIINQSYISNNVAELGGGGIYCAGSEASVLIGQGSHVMLNQATSATGQGGGAYVVSDCTLSMYSAGINSNRARSDGGGLYAADGAKVVMIGYEFCVDVACFGNQLNDIRLFNNTADSDLSGQGEGGAIYATGNDTLVRISQARIDNNSAHNGGAISARDGADFMLLGPNKSCINRLSPFSKRCNIFDANFARNSGGALYSNGGEINVNQFTFENNRADLGIAIAAFNKNSGVVVNGSMFIRNGNNGFEEKGVEFLDFNVVVAIDALVEFKHTTFAENKAISSVLNISNTPNSQLNVINSIIYDSESGTVLNSTPGLNFFSCVIAHETNSFSGDQLLAADPKFRNIDVGDFHLNAQTSPAVDFCTDTSGSGFIDIDTEIGGWDDPSRPNHNDNPAAGYDAGADETFDNDIIFKHGFDLTIDDL